MSYEYDNNDRTGYSVNAESGNSMNGIEQPVRTFKCPHMNISSQAIESVKCGICGNLEAETDVRYG